ncbi:PR38A-like protein [Mya arenaria]|uniref:Pre-mRNA-splicing factor 38 n=1 Tax=Mya arenaria TaxID=6604 RepID=A0ABY7FQF8_MYAAR|nr:PR38A-like protein [Mya arenaria]
MANRTVKDAHSIKGTNPQYLIEKITRTRIYECRYWKEECFALTAELLVDKAMGLKYIGGVYGGNIKPAPFLCLLLKMLQIQPEKDIIVEFIRNEDFKYVRALGSLYMRLTGTSIDCYKYLEPLYLDYRKLKRQKNDGSFELLHMDEFIDELIREERDIYKAASSEKRKINRELDRPARSPSPTRGRRSPSPHHSDRDKDRDRGREDDRHKDRHRHRDHGGRPDKKMSKDEQEIQEANELRAKLGMAPLRP